MNLVKLDDYGRRERDTRTFRRGERKESNESNQVSIGLEMTEILKKDHHECNKEK